MALSLFGFTLVKDKKPEDLKNQSIIEPVSYDGPTTVTAGGYYGTYVDIDASARSESELITRYREIANYPDCDNAIEEIVAEAIAVVHNEVPVKIQELRYIDPRKIRKVRQLKKEKTKEGLELITKAEEFFIYNDKGLNYLSPGVSPAGSNSSGVRIATDTIAFCPSGLMDLNRNLVIGYMHKAIKPVNQLKMMADSLVIYRLARAPERRIFYIDVGNLPKMKDIMARYRNKVVYDSNTGEIKDDRKFMTMLEDFWLPRREGGRGTEITTLPGGQNLGEIADIDYFQNKVYQSLNIPTSRFQQSSGFNFGRSAEISHEEMKFSKFISRLRKKFDHLFNDILRTQLILKNIVTDSDWEQIKEKVYYRYASDQYFEEQKNAENLRNKLEVLTQLQPFVGTFFSKDYVRKNVLNLEQEDIDKIEAENQQEPVEQPPEEQ